jgi:broad specificity phosphatase PhoE
MKIYIVRHGESEGNLNKSYQSPDTSLSNKGIKEAHILAKRLKDLSIDFIYSSNFKRARQTSEIISKKLNLKIEFWSELRELTRPSILWGKPIESQSGKKFEKQVDKNYANAEWKFMEYESVNDLKKRAQKILKHILKHHKNQDILLISHGTFIKMVISLMIFDKILTPEIFWYIRRHFSLGNTGITICEHSEKYGWSLKTWNDTTHLSSLFQY